MNITPDKTRRTIVGYSNLNNTREFRNLKAMSGIIAGTLDRWLGTEEKGIGTERRHKFIAYVFPETNGSTRNMTPAQLAGMLDWMDLDKDLAGRYVDSPIWEGLRDQALACVKQYEIEHGQSEMALA